MGGWVDGWMGGWVDGWMGGLMDGGSRRSILFKATCDRLHSDPA
ncbi:MAG: hypothetical protein AAFX01_14600 [Cyanobacteria bacterium J06638_28]